MPDSATKTPKRRPLDDETAAALTLYNTYLVADREQRAHERALRKAEKTKDEAAAAVRKLNERKANASETAEAEAKYRQAAEALQRLRDGGSSASDDEDDQGGSDKAAASSAEGKTDDDDTATGEQTDGAAGEKADEPDENGEEASSVGVEASVGDDDLAGDEPAGVAG